MIRLDERNAECLVFTQKEGLMAAVGHDLKIRVTRFELALSEDWTAVEGTFDAGSLRVVCAQRDGTDDPKALPSSDRLKIEQTLRDEVLHATTHAKVRFHSKSVHRDGDAVHVEGELSLHGRDHPITATGVLKGDRWTVEARLNQPDWGMRPYSAMLGALRVKSEVVVRVSFPAQLLSGLSNVPDR